MIAVVSLFRFLFVPRYRIFTHRRVVRQRLLALFTVGLALVAGAAYARAATNALLKANIAVDGAYVTLGDLFETSAFDMAPDARAVVITSAPAPGEEITLDAARLRQLAAERGVAWPNAERLETITVARASQLIGASQVEAALTDAIAAQGKAGTLRIRFSGAAPVLRVALGAPTTLAVDSLEFDDRTGQFRASVRAPANDTRAPATLLIGRAYEVAEIPVLARDVQPGETLAAPDFTFSEVPTERLGQNTLTNVSALIGMAPKRMLRAGQPLRLGDVAMPLVVNKNELVSMVVRVEGMTLTAQGRALDDGALNSTIRVLNTLSKRTVQATVTAPGEVTVQTTALLVSQR